MGVDINSLLTYIDIKREGLLGEMQEKVFDCLCQNEALTDKEIADKLCMAINCIVPRRNELEKMGCIEPVTTVIQSNGRPAWQWQAKLAGIKFRKLNKQQHPKQLKLKRFV